MKKFNYGKIFLLVALILMLGVRRGEATTV